MRPSPNAPANQSESRKLITTHGRHLDTLRTPWGQRRFEWSATGTLIQRTMTDENKTWEVVQTADTITPGNVHFNPKSYRAKLMTKDGDRRIANAARRHPPRPRQPVA